MTDELAALRARVAELEAENQALHGRIVEGDYAGLKRVAELEAALREMVQWVRHYEMISLFRSPHLRLAVAKADSALGNDHG